METVYRAHNGKIFTNAKECAEYDNILSRATALIIEVRNWCQSTNDSCTDCPFFTKDEKCIFDEFPCNWEIKDL